MKVEDFFGERSLDSREGIKSADQLWEFLIRTDAHEKYRMPKGKLFYRGQSDASHGLNSTLYRLIAGRRAVARTPSAFKHDAETAMREAEDEVITVARQNGLGMGLSDLELLGLLQHHGMPTRLIDVSISPLSALYFAVEKQDEKPGRLFVLTARDVLRHSATTGFLGDGTSQPASLPWVTSRKTTSTWRQTVYEAQMSPLDARMIAQDASFLVGGIYTSGGKLQQYFYGSTSKPKMIDIDSLREISTLIISFPKKDNAPKKTTRWGAYGWTILIPAEWKSDLRKRLEDHTPRINSDSIYPPIAEVKRLVSHVAWESLNQ